MCLQSHFEPSLVSALAIFLRVHDLSPASRALTTGVRWRGVAVVTILRRALSGNINLPRQRESTQVRPILAASSGFTVERFAFNIFSATWGDDARRSDRGIPKISVAGGQKANRPPLTDGYRAQTSEERFSLGSRCGCKGVCRNDSGR